MIGKTSKNVKIVEIGTLFDAHLDKFFYSKYVKYCSLSSEMSSLGFDTMNTLIIDHSWILDHGWKVWNLIIDQVRIIGHGRKPQS